MKRLELKQGYENKVNAKGDLLSDHRYRSITLSGSRERDAHGVSSVVARGEEKVVLYHIDEIDSFKAIVAITN